MSSGEDVKSSTQVWGGEDGFTVINDHPPAYSGIQPEETERQRPQLPSRPTRRKLFAKDPYDPIRAMARWSKVPWGKYVVPDAVVSADRTTIITTNKLFLSSHQGLVKLLVEQANLPPMPTVRITGNHLESTPRTQKVDFDVIVSLSTLLDLSRPARWRNKPAQVVPLPSPDGRTRASSAVSGNNSPQIEVLSRQFLEDKSDRKSFMLTRAVDNIPTDVIEGWIRNLVASLHYRGKLNVSFPVQCGQLMVQKKKPAGTGAAVGGWFMNMLGLSPDVRYETLERVWEIGVPSSSIVSYEPDDDTVRNVGGGGDGVDVDSATTSAEAPSSLMTEQIEDTNVLLKQWWTAWSPAIRNAILAKRKGKIGIEDWMEARIGWHLEAPTRDWGVDYVVSR